MLALGLWWGQGTAAAATVAVPLPLCPPPSRGSGKGGGHRCRGGAQLTARPAVLRVPRGQGPGPRLLCQGQRQLGFCPLSFGCPDATLAYCHQPRGREPGHCHRAWIHSRASMANFCPAVVVRCQRGSGIVSDPKPCRSSGEPSPATPSAPHIYTRLPLSQNKTEQTHLSFGTDSTQKRRRVCPRRCAPRALGWLLDPQCHSFPSLLYTELLNSNPCSKVCPADRGLGSRM